MMADTTQQPATEPRSDGPTDLRQDATAAVEASEERPRPPLPDADDVSNGRDSWTGDRERLREDLKTEYYKIADLVVGFDQRLLTIKGWGVTLSLASLGLGFQQGHYGLFLVAAASGLGFWIIEAVAKTHQIRYYPRMRDIECASYSLYRVISDEGAVTSPLIDWAWKTAPYRWKKYDPQFERPKRYGEDHGEDENMWRPQSRVVDTIRFSSVVFPHIIAVVGGLILFFLGLTDHLNGIKL
jgi:hypothetical protein